MNEPVITQKKVLDTIQLEGQYNFSVYTTIGLADSGDFYLELEFTNLTVDDFKILAHLRKQQKHLQISSKLIDTEKYNITHIVVTNFTESNMLQITWKCLSDDPNMYSDLNLK
ncbi:MAG: hypothetical protein COA57_06280 [Flavobacteriales bacterium]|nr:MAG: hypothetical protein COA57_06280 [Flavobacteriales bacterium]